jgi:two-component system, chemotaxis family, CheB/CheR fusion protein
MAADQDLDGILERVREARSCDFRQYKKATLRRRIERRMKDRKCRDLTAYMRLLDAEPEEIDRLVSSLLIKVSSFFRDGDPWELLRSKILPQMIAGKKPGEELRIWCAGCATGEEAYSAAMVVADVLGAAFATFPVKVFGTDVDQQAIGFARRGIYTREAVESVSEEQRRRWFTPGPEGFAVKKEVRRVVVFGVNDLVTDAPISRLDLLLCRNVFIYLDSNLQKKVLTRFHYAMRPDGLLMLGKSELIPFAARIFHPVDLPRRLYRKQRPEELLGLGQQGLLGLMQQQASPGEPRDIDSDLAFIGRLNRDIVSALPFPVLGTALDGTMIMWNREAGRLWGRAEGEVIGKKLQALNLPGLGVEALAGVPTALKDRKHERHSFDTLVNRGPGLPQLTMSVEVTQLRGANDEPFGLLYRLQDISGLRAMESELRRVNEERQTVHVELQATNQELQSANEELEATNEELQSANEELQTTNEELQSINEELETTNEELHSANAELDATNRELAYRTEELNLASYHQRTLIRSLSAAVVVLDAQGRINVWNLAAERLLGLPESEAVGQLVWSLAIPALRREQLQRIRRSLGQALALRFENVAYDLPSGGKGRASMAAIPISEGENYLGAVLIFEDVTRHLALGAADRKPADKRPAGPPAKLAKLGKLSGAAVARLRAASIGKPARATKRGAATRPAPRRRKPQ